MNENKVLITGTVGMMKIFQSQGGLHIVKFGLCKSSKAKTPGSEWKYQWFNCVAFGETAELIEKEITKGCKIYIEGRLSQSSWKDKNTGENRTSTDIIINSFTIVINSASIPTDNYEMNLGATQTNKKDEAFIEDDAIPF